MAEAENARRQLTTLFETASIPLHWVGPDGIIQWANDAELAMLGYTKGEYEGQDIRKFHVDKKAIDDILARLKRGERIKNYPARLRRKDGSIREVLIDSSVLRDDSRFIHTQCFTRDVTDSNRAERASQYLAAIIESSEDAIISKDLNGIVTSWNQGAERIFGYTAEEVIGKSVTMLIPPDRQEEEPAILQRIRAGERIDHFETIRRRKDGALLDISLTISPIKDSNGRLVGASKIARDISSRKQTEAALNDARDQLTRANQQLEQSVRERTAELERANAALLRQIEEDRRLQEQLWQAQKMESVGTLAAGIAHDFNNILNIITGYTTLLRRSAGHGEQMTESLSVIQETIERGASLVRQMLTVARKTEARLKPVNLNDQISGLVNVLEQTFPKTIAISQDLQSTLPPVVADPNQVTQVLLNLSVNARDAMPSGGRLTFKTAVVEGSAIKESTPQSGYFACIEVRDTGTGIAPDIAGRIFEPFFTTKGVGQGSGLGLATAYGIIKNHHGFIDVISEPGHGTTFRVYLPLGNALEKSGDEALRYDGTVLVVEDEQNMLRLLTDILAAEGYRVLPALDGAQAIELYRRHKSDIDVVLLDIGLPKVAGSDVLTHIKEENPDVNVLIASGYIEPEFKSRVCAAGVTGFIDKPYLPEEVVRTIRGIVSGRHGSRYCQ